MRKTAHSKRRYWEKFVQATLAIALAGAMFPTNAWSDDNPSEASSASRNITSSSRLITASATQHATLTLTATLWNGGSRTGTAYGSQGVSGYGVVNGYILRSVSASMNTGGLTGGVTGVSLVNPSNPNDWRTRFKMSLYGQVASAYSVMYWVHGADQQASRGDTGSDGAWVHHNNAGIDGIGWKLIPRSYVHTIQARFQQADGSWSGYSSQRSGSYAYLSTVPAWSRSADATYQAASTAAYTASFSAKTTSVDVYRRSYTASFDAQGGSDCSDAQRQLLCGAELGTLPEPVREGYRFEGWYDDPTSGQRITAESAMPTSDTTYYAHWSYGVAYLANEGEGFMPEKRLLVGADDEYTAPDSSYTKPGSRFLCWNTESEGTGISFKPGDALKDDAGDPLRPDSPLADVTVGEGEDIPCIRLYAQWEPIQVRFDAPSEIVCSIDAEGTLFGPPDDTITIQSETDVGLTVEGIRTQGNGHELPSEQPEHSGEFNLTLRPKDGSPVSLAQFCGDGFIAPAHKDEWRIPANGKLALNAIGGQTAGIDAVSVEGTKIGSVQWLLKPTVITIRYQSDEATEALPEQHANAELAYFLPEAPPLSSGKAFAGWTTTANGTGHVYRTGEPAAFATDTTLYALWQ